MQTYTHHHATLIAEAIKLCGMPGLANFNFQYKKKQCEKRKRKMSLISLQKKRIKAGELTQKGY